MKQRIVLKGILCAALIVFSAALFAEDITVSLPLIEPNIALKDGKPTGAFVDLLNEMMAHYKGGKIKIIGVFPMARSVANVIEGKADFHFPFNRGKNEDVSKIPYDFVPTPIGKIAFVLYSKADAKPLDIKNLGKYSIESTRGMSRYFNFKITEVEGPESSIARILDGRVDGCILPLDAGDPYLIARKIKNIRRELFTDYDTCLIVGKSPRAVKVKKILDDLIKEMIKDKSIYKYAGKTYDLPWTDWQPDKMGW